MLWLATVFALTAFAYAAIGFGGGSTYTALLALADVDYRLLPLVSLSCNILVVAGGTAVFARASAVPWARVLPILIVSVPLAWIGGRIDVPELLFLALLSAALFAAGVLMLWAPRPDRAPHAHSARIGALIGGGVGFVSGLVGIGGGIFLAPVLYRLGWGRPREIAGTASVFILVNSVAGLAGQLAKRGEAGLDGLIAYWPLALAVILGGQAGSHLGARFLSAAWLSRLTAGLVLFVACRLAWQVIGRIVTTPFV